jgi:acyl carrier protein
MTIEGFIEKIEDAIDTLPKGALKPDTNYREMAEWSSMHALIIIALVDTDYNVTINGNDIRKCVTVNDLFNVIKSRLA